MDKKYANYILNKTVLDYNKIADKYSRVREKSWQEMEFLFDRLKEGDRALDLGCGNGRFYGLFKKRGAGYVGIDNSEKMIGIAKEKYPEADFRTASGLDIPFPDSSFDKVYGIAVLHHIPGRELRLAFLEESRRVLKEGGNLVLTVWDFKEKTGKAGIFDWFKKRKLEKGDLLLPWYGSADTYFHCFNLKELVQLVKEAGFKVVEQGEISVGLKPYSNFYIVAEK
jgi:ubiquinone/menaquinone biosynthesis C-methylase UbiE